MPYEWTELTLLSGAGAPSAELTSVYAYALQRGQIMAGDEAPAAELGLSQSVVGAAITRLKLLRLLRHETAGDRCRLVPVNPEVASASLISPIDEEVHRRRATISEIRKHLNAFQPHYEETQRTRPTGGDIEELGEASDLAGHLYVAAQRCTQEFVGFPATGWLTSRQSPAHPFALGGLTGLVDRGVRVRLLTQHAVRTDFRARALLDALIGGGAEIRTTGQQPRQVMIFDTDVAFLLHDKAAAGSVGVVIQHGATVRLLLDVVESSWNSGQAYAAKEIGYHEVADSLQRTIVELLADGLTDEAIARRLGVSVRTCRRHIATVLRNLDAVSRFQAGVLAAAAGIVERRGRADDASMSCA